MSRKFQDWQEISLSARPSPHPTMLVSVRVADRITDENRLSEPGAPSARCAQRLSSFLTSRGRSARVTAGWPHLSGGHITITRGVATVLAARVYAPGCALRFLVIPAVADRLGRRQRVAPGNCLQGHSIRIAGTAGILPRSVTGVPRGSARRPTMAGRLAVIGACGAC